MNRFKNFNFNELAEDISDLAKNEEGTREHKVYLEHNGNDYVMFITTSFSNTNNNDGDYWTPDSYSYSVSLDSLTCYEDLSFDENVELTDLENDFIFNNLEEKINYNE